MPKNHCRPSFVVSGGKEIISSTLEARGAMPSFETVWPRYLTERSPKMHFFRLIETPWSASSENKLRRCFLRESWSGLATSISSRYTKVYWTSQSIPSISLWKAWVAFLRPKGILKNSNRPKGVIIVVLGTSSGAIGI